MILSIHQGSRTWPGLVCPFVGDLSVGLLALGCATSQTAPVDSPAEVASARTLSIVAEGPCSKLSVAHVGERVFILYGTTGYELRDWNEGEQLAAAQSFAELRRGRAFRNLTLLQGLPLDDRGYVDGDLRMGGTFDGNAWLATTDTRYSPRGAGRLFVRDHQLFVWSEDRWSQRRTKSDALTVPSHHEFPRLDPSRFCSDIDEALTFEPLTSSQTAEGFVAVAGRCQNAAPIHHRDPAIIVAHTSRTQRSWTHTRLPRTDYLDANLNVTLFAMGPGEVYASLYEPFKPLDQRLAYLARYDGSTWHREKVPIRTGITSIAGTSDGTLWAAAGRDLWRRERGTWSTVELPALLSAVPERPETLRITRVAVTPGDHLWVEAAYRVKLKLDEQDADVRASVLFSTWPMTTPLYCDSSLPVEEALVAVEEP